MKKIRTSWVWLISTLIWSIEKIFFYPKLFIAYRNLNLLNKIKIGESLTVFDVGANKGQSVNFFKKLYPQSKIFAFEPSEKTFNSLKEFVQDKSYQDVYIFQVGMGEIQGTMIFYESGLDETSTFVLPNQDSRYLRIKNRILFQNNEEAFNAVNVEVITFDNFAEKNKILYVDVLKIDVEGFELEVLRGARNALANGKIGIIQFERHSDDMREDNYPAIRELLLENGYRLIQEIDHPFGDFRELLYQKNKGHL
jgi:FkbM family methyltransferase